MDARLRCLVLRMVDNCSVPAPSDSLLLYLTSVVTVLVVGNTCPPTSASESDCVCTPASVAVKAFSCLLAASAAALTALTLPREERRSPVDGVVLSDAWVMLRTPADAFGVVAYDLPMISWPAMQSF